MEIFDAIIIGAGAAGIAAGCKLLENNLKKIVILEAKNRIGGRIHSHEVDGSFLDLGGQWCHGQENNIVFSLTKDLDILSPSINAYDDYTLYTPSISLDKKLLEEILMIGYVIEQDEDALKSFNSSFGDYFVSRFYTEITQKYGKDENTLMVAKLVCDWYHKLVNCINASATWFDLSAKGLLNYEVCQGNNYLNFRNKGYKTILDVLMKKVPDSTQALPLESKIHLNKVVENIKWNSSDAVAVECEDGSLYRAKCVLITTSLGVLKKTHNKLFTPELPLYKVNAIQGLGFGLVNKIFLKFSHWWWFDDPKGISILWSDQDRKFISKAVSCNSIKGKTNWLEDIPGFYPIDSHTNILMAWITGSNAAAVEDLHDDEIITALMALLRYYVGHKYEIPHPVEIIRSRWQSDPYFCGSYSYRSNASEDLNVSACDLAKPVCFNSKPVLLFAGEATSDNHYSTVHGAIGSGFREANRILKLSKGMEKLSKL